ncbi:hypothetical protein [Agrobacterium tumefaciens]|uniref:hypothetical protein n=1 Tax=Agrobacterium tumefaciens TaxID=358 RepID=UPI001574A989|nr:hypothetical protein [Agrobacterium tumefaciens]NTE01539.1 hypothetical protein [Agrobacterium tumefaciens]NTE11799.1 hypothetical protein [Agrobacterium tumefaciens]NTE31987.1 hypothetical protein [Agrobacterium tumefaciens]
MKRLAFIRHTVFSAAVLSAAILSPAYAEPLTLTKLRAPESQDPSNGIGLIMRDVWASEIKAVGERAYSFSYGLFKAGDAQYLVSSFRSAESCRPDECTWIVQRLTPSYKVAASGKPFTACGALNDLDVKEGRLTICGKGADLP